jgi:uncharacterized protein (TIGR02118 family)
MVRLTVLYNKPDDPDAFLKHYESTHAPLVDKISNLSRWTWGKVLGTPTGDEAPYFLTAELWFEDMDAFGTAMGSPEGQAAANDMANFATGGATTLIAEGH